MGTHASAHRPCGVVVDGIHSRSRRLVPWRRRCVGSNSLCGGGGRRGLITALRVIHHWYVVHPPLICGMISWVKMLTETRPKNHSIVVLSLLLLNFQVRNDPETFSNMTSMPYTKNSMNKWIPHKKKTRWKIFFYLCFSFTQQMT